MAIIRGKNISSLLQQGTKMVSPKFSSTFKGKNLNPDLVSTYAVLNNLKNCKPAKSIMGNLVVNGIHEVKPSIISKMIISYAKVGFLGDALKMLVGFNSNDVYSANAILSGYLKQNKTTDASILFEKTLDTLGIKPSAFTYGVFVKILYDDKQWDLTLSKIEEMRSLGLRLDESICKIYVTMLCKSTRMVDAFQFVRNGESSSIRLLNVFVKESGLLNDFKNMWAVIAHMWKSGFLPNDFTYEHVISAFFKFGTSDEALKMTVKVVLEDHASSNLLNSTLRSCLKMGLQKEVSVIADLMESRSMLIQPDLRLLFLAAVYPCF